MDHDKHADWELMHSAYKHNMELLEQLYTIFLTPESFKLDNEFNIVMAPDVKPLHVKWHTVYHAILKLQARSVFEFGFGFGHNLHNLETLSSDIATHGIDIAIRQYEHAILLQPRLANRIFVWDGAERLDSAYDNSADVAFSRGVIMFLARHMEVLHNMFSVAKKYVILLEGWHAHNFHQDIKAYSESSEFPWSDLYMYSYDTGVKDVKDTIKAMVCSREPIEAEWVRPLNSDAELRSQ